MTNYIICSVRQISCYGGLVKENEFGGACFRQMRKTCKLTLRRLMSYIYGAPILDVSRSHTTTQHSR